MDEERVKSGVRVYVRLRPVIHDEEQEPEETCIRAVAHNKVEVLNWRDTRETLEYPFKQVFAEDSSQEEIFCTSVQPLVSRFVELRQNVTVFAYGPTGAGKTFTILGTNAYPGIIPRTIRALFSRVRQKSSNDDHFSISMSYVEIYQEKVFDLFKKERKVLAIRQDIDGNILVPGLSIEQITNFEMFEKLFIPASENRKVEATKLNIRSSRSHSLLIIQLQYWRLSNPNKIQTAKLNLIDLAGSEDNRRTGNTGVRLKESGSINSSLHVLGKVVNALNSGTNGRVPYRDSKLTRLLQDSLGGSAHTCMIVNIAPEISSLFDTYSTLNFGTKTKNVLNRPFTRETDSLNHPEVKLRSGEKTITTPKRSNDSSVDPNIQKSSPAPFLSPLIQKHVDKLESKFLSRLEDLEKQIMKTYDNEKGEIDEQTEENFRKHDLNLEEIRKSAKKFKALHSEQSLLKEKRKKRKRLLQEEAMHKLLTEMNAPTDDSSPFPLKRKRIFTAAEVHLKQNRSNDMSMMEGAHGCTMLTIEKQHGKQRSDGDVITVKVCSETRQKQVSKILRTLNTGSESELKKHLYGIGSVRANQILRYREENGNFENIQDLEKVLPQSFVDKFLQRTILQNFHIELE